LPVAYGGKQNNTRARQDKFQAVRETAPCGVELQTEVAGRICLRQTGLSVPIFLLRKKYFHYYPLRG
jgi:hypothetical protein